MSTAAPQDTAYITFVADINDVGCRTLLSTVSSLVAAGKQEIHLLMASTGGNVMHGFSAYNGLRALPVKLVTHNIGNIDSISNVVFMSADDRYANAHSTFMFHGVAMQVSRCPRRALRTLQRV
jgi:ATP-dependent protease ClpP protease subunit